ncbi:MAG: nucleotidyltransferase domain-containing protein [Acidobacteria bacterium]|nr:nucleotidyltransferase domain-containing protein [Acidobacteriota bacterium]MCB9399390.1 nucleotidyltransferase domain-containing protein [Acidobacteriota bacterium]
MFAEIQAALRTLCEKEQMTLLFACESGSRAWDFPSLDSDYDVRFIYHKDPRFYFRLNRDRDHFDAMLPNDLDISGWDLPKALNLFHQGNVALFEWLQSSIVYFADDIFCTQLRKLIPDYFNPRKAVYHYLALAKNAEMNKADDGTVRYKKLFYRLRALCAAHYVELRREMPPTSLRKVLEAHLEPQQVCGVIEEWTERKARSTEADRLALPDWVETWLSGLESHLEECVSVLPIARRKDFDPLNELVLTTLGV